jgi:hypothetical protein
MQMRQEYKIPRTPLTLAAVLVNDEPLHMEVEVINGDLTASVTCIHAVVGETSFEDIASDCPPKLHSTEFCTSVLSPEDHFFALCSFTQKLSEDIGTLQDPTQWWDTSDDYNDTSLRCQFRKAVQAVAPDYLNYLYWRDLADIAKESKEWVEERFWILWDRFAPLIFGTVKGGEEFDIDYSSINSLIKHAEHLIIIFEQVANSCKTKLIVRSRNARQTKINIVAKYQKYYIRAWIVKNCSIMRVSDAWVGDSSKEYRLPITVFADRVKRLFEHLSLKALIIGNV